MRDLVARVIGEAKAKAGKAGALLALIHPLLNETYSERSVSSWIKGHNMPNADVLLAAAKVSGISLDELLYGESLKSRQDRLERELGDLRQALEGRVDPSNG